MKLRFILPSVIFLFSGLVARGQVSTPLFQGFETSDVEHFTVTPSSSKTYSTTFFNAGSRSLELRQSTSEEVTLLLDTLDFSNTTSRLYISLDFDHICDVAAQSGNTQVCRLYYKLCSETQWHQVSSGFYDMTEGGTSYFRRQSAFDRSAYNSWSTATLTNSDWKHERFNLNDQVNERSAGNQRKLMFKLTIRQSANNTTGTWRLDNLRVRVSSSPMTSPRIDMVNYPDGYYYPSSRGAHIVLDASTTVTPPGINQDSVYLYYRVGANGTPVRLQMAPVTGASGRFAADIPFFGYDTLMSFYCVARDATSNANMTTYPRAVDSWINYTCVRGVEQNGVERSPFIGTSSSSEFPFTNKADGRSEWVYTQHWLDSAGYKSGEMVAMRFTLAENATEVTRRRFQVKMRNVEPDYVVSTASSTHLFTTDFMKVVYDGPLTINEANTNDSQTLNFQDTFYYAGKDIVMQVTYDGEVDVPSTRIKMISANSQKQSFYSMDGDADYGYHPFNGTDMAAGNAYSTLAPALVFTQKANLPLLYDMGFDTVRTKRASDNTLYPNPHYGLVRPSYDTAMTPDDHRIQVRLKNWGALTANAIRISYEINRGNTTVTSGHYDWNGTLQGDSVQLVTIAPNVTLSAGAYQIKVWVEDTLTAGGIQYRDHEPLNDTIKSEFIVCAGAMNGVRHIGGATADFATVKDFLFALERCGVDDSLVVKLAPDTYKPFRMPVVSGVSEQHYVVFEPESNGVSFVSQTNGDSIVNLEDASHVRFRNIKFVRRAGTLENMVRLGQNSVDCHFEGCEFVDSLTSGQNRISALINTGYANGTIIDGCRFVGGKVGVNVKGMSSEYLSTGNIVKNSWFSNQYDNAVNATYQDSVVIERNEMYDVMSNTTGVLSLSSCGGQSRVWGNKIYTTHGASGMSLSNLMGTSEKHFLVANNMVVCNDGGTGNLLRSPINVISATWTDVVYNSVKMVATRRSNIATATFGNGGTSIQNSLFVNNIVVCLDNNNYALEYKPGTSTTNTVGHNVYYTLGSVLNKKAGAASMTLADWAMAVPGDTNSVSLNPNFLNGSLVDLRTFNRLVRGVGVPIATVTTDMFDTLRNDTATCPGAFEFLSLRYDIEPEALVSPLAVDCHMPQQVALSVLLRNSGTSGYRGNGLQLGYQLNGGTPQTVVITDSIPAEDTLTIATNVMLQLPPNGIRDSVHTLKVYTIFTEDPNQTNDTNVFSVTSKYHPARPNDDSVQIAYATAATITPTQGVEQWQMYRALNATMPPLLRSEIYWYRDSTDATPFFVGNTLTTDTLRRDTTFYFRQKRSKPIVRITQLEFKKDGAGTTPDAPYWLNSGRKIALQLTNVGDARADISGDTIQTISPEGTSLNDKKFVIPQGVYIEPGESLVIQWATGTSADPTKTIHTGNTSLTVAYNKKIAFVYRHGGVIEDAVAMNDINATPGQNMTVTWANANVPSWVWSGSGVNVSGSSTTAGLVRTSLMHGNMQDWIVASNTSGNKMFLGTTDAKWIRFTDNGCEGYLAKFKVKMEEPPAVDIDMGTPVLPSDVCGLGMENVAVTVRNYGIQPVNGLTLSYTTGGVDTVTETVNQTIAAGGAITYTFAGQLNMNFAHDSLLTVKVWADTVSGDNIQNNDTNMTTVWVPFTPDAPDTMPVRTVPYAEVDTIQLAPVAGQIPVWYDYEGNVVDTGYTNYSEILYVGGTRGVSYMVWRQYQGIIGTATTSNTPNQFPSPYQPKSKYAKQQYIYSASDMKAAGLEAGYIDSIAFNFKTIGGNNPAASMSFNEYTISMGLTNDTIFATTSDWKSTTPVYTRTPLVVYQADANKWINHHLDHPYYWDGESSLVVQIVHHIASNISSGASATYTAKTNTVLSKDGSAELNPSTAGFVGAGSRGNNRPNIRINNTAYGCEGPITPYSVQLVNMPATDVTVLWPNGIDTVQYNSCNDIPFYVKVRNQGTSDVTGAKLFYYFDDMAVDSTMVEDTIVSGETENILLFSRHIAPGRHSLKVIVSAPGDNIHSNDTIRRSFVVRFCNGSYTIAATDGDYHSFGETIDTLNVVGIQGPVVFNVAPGTYNEQVRLNNIQGSSNEHTISFVGTGNDVLLTAATTQNANYVMLLDSTSHVSLSNFRIEARPTAAGAAGNYANALVIQKGGDIAIDSMSIKVKGTILNSPTASCVVLQGEIDSLTFTNNVMDSGYYSLRSSGSTAGSNIVITGNLFRNFLSQGVNLRGVTNLVVDENDIRSGVTISARGLTGLYLAQMAGSFSVQKNKINLIDDRNGGKRGIQLEQINGTTIAPGKVYNNMISCSGTGTAGLNPAKPSGIWIDSSSTSVNIFFNTVRLYCGANANAQYSDASYAFFSGTTVSNIQVMNNIFANLSKGYAYYVSENNTISISDFNDYYTQSNRPIWWKQYRTGLAALRTANNDDANSVAGEDYEPYFVADDDLHLVMTNVAGIAQYNPEVSEDIDGRIRHQQDPGPTMGAAELDIVTHDMAVVRTFEPTMPASLNFNPPNNMPPHIEGDPVRVIAKFYNNGLSPETNVQWYAYIEGHESTTRTTMKNLGSFAPAESKIDTIMMPTVLGITDTNIVHVVVVLPTDTVLSNNDRTANMYLAPAYNLAATQMSTDHTGCYMENTIVKISIRNAGYKDFPADTVFKIGFRPEITAPTDVTVPTMPTAPIEEYVSLDNPLLMGRTITLSFTQPVNLYPTNVEPSTIAANGMKVRLLGWVNYSLDFSQANDSTPKNATAISSYYTPAPPVGVSPWFSYGTWGEVEASQENNRPIRWYRDSTATPFYSPSQYAASCRWTNTPQYFHDTTYYLCCLSEKGCQSHFDSVTVHVITPYENDMAMESVLAPVGGRVYMEDDTVRVVVRNFGTRSQSNVPIAYQLKKGNEIVQNVTEICRATIPAGQSYTYTFNQLLNITTPTLSQNYSLLVWTDLVTDESRRSDTIRTPKTFRSLPESTYKRRKPSSPSFDITRVSFSEIDFECPPLGRGLTDLASYNSPDYPAVHVSRGLTDTLFVQVTPLDASAQRERVKIWTYIDFNRDGNFSANEKLVDGDVFYDDATYSAPITISNTASFGYMRMRLVVGSNDDVNTLGDTISYGVPTNKSGHNMDFLLFVDAEPPAVDLAVTQIVSPRSYLIRDDQPHTISFRVANKGTEAVDNPTFFYNFAADVTDSTSQGTVAYPGTIQPGTSAVLTLPSHVFPLGVTNLTIWHETPNDAIPANNQLVFQYNRFHIVRLVMNDDFDTDNKWYAPVGNNLYSHNYWEQGTPNKTKLNAAYSAPNAWVTDLNNTITTGTRGNVSYLYSPIINISQIHPDTLSFRLRRNLTNNSSLRLEFYNFENKWVNVNADSLTNWYNNTDKECFDNTTAGNDYNYYWIPTSLISGDFNENTQFRFVYTTPMSASATASFGEGCAVDDFRIGRARRPVDVGIVDIPYPTAPAYGQTIYPKVVVKNYGTDTIRSLDLGYIHYGTYLPKETHLTCRLAPLATDTFTFNSSFVVTSDFPDTFHITAFTITQADIYRDNDSCTRRFPLSPLANDISANAILYPLDHVVAGDSLQVTLRMRNFGATPITDATATYIANGQLRVDENLDFVSLLGRPLNSMEYFNYTFTQRFRAPMGVVRLTGIVKSPQNDYIYNDTVTKRIEAINSVHDIAAAAVIVDTSGHNEVRISLVIENRGARGANGFQVGFYIDDDSSTIYREVYSRSEPLAALQTDYYSFNATLPQRSARYSKVTAFVHAREDNDRSNDTTKTIARQFFDLEMVKTIVVENSDPDCKVYAVVRNIGNIPLVSGQIHVEANINGNQISDNFRHNLMAGQTLAFPFQERIPKSPVRRYQGSARLSYGSDNNAENNQSSIIEVRGYMEDVPLVESNSLVLEQNYPNPFEDRTTIPFTLPNDADVRFFIIDAMGHIVNSFNRHFSAGAQSVTADMSSYPSGIYYYGIEVDGQRRMKKMLLR